jgi:hypothetical protein
MTLRFATVTYTFHVVVTDIEIKEVPQIETDGDGTSQVVVVQIEVACVTHKRQWHEIGNTQTSTHNTRHNNSCGNVRSGRTLLLPKLGDPSPLGKLPVNSLSPKYKLISWDSFETSSDILPVNRFACKYRDCKFTNS